MRATRRTRRQAPANIPRGEYSEARAKASGRSQGLEDDPGRDGNPGAREGSPQGMETIPGAGRQRRAEVVRGICEVTSADDHTAEGQRRRGSEAQRCRSVEAQRVRGAEGQRRRGSEAQRCRSTEGQRCRGAEVQRRRGSEAQAPRGRRASAKSNHRAGQGAAHRAGPTANRQPPAKGRALSGATPMGKG